MGPENLYFYFPDHNDAGGQSAPGQPLHFMMGRQQEDQKLLSNRTGVQEGALYSSIPWGKFSSPINKLVSTLQHSLYQVPNMVPCTKKTFHALPRLNPNNSFCWISSLLYPDFSVTSIVPSISAYYDPKKLLTYF